MDGLPGHAETGGYFSRGQSLAGQFGNPGLPDQVSATGDIDFITAELDAPCLYFGANF
jgi:hypothetical protein